MYNTIIFLSQIKFFSRSLYFNYIKNVNKIIYLYIVIKSAKKVL